jgi:exosortase/archaeosortase family protein
VRASHLAVTLALAVGAVLVGNSLRAAALFVVETRSASFPALAHDAVGIAAFVLTCASILAVALRRDHVR